jgi:hypothetical protein
VLTSAGFGPPQWNEVYAVLIRAVTTTKDATTDGQRMSAALRYGEQASRHEGESGAYRRPTTALLAAPAGPTTNRCLSEVRRFIDDCGLFGDVDLFQPGTDDSWAPPVSTQVTVEREHKRNACR